VKTHQKKEKMESSEDDEEEDVIARRRRELHDEKKESKEEKKREEAAHKESEEEEEEKDGKEAKEVKEEDQPDFGPLKSSTSYMTCVMDRFVGGGSGGIDVCERRKSNAVLGLQCRSFTIFLSGLFFACVRLLLSLETRPPSEQDLARFKLHEDRLPCASMYEKSYMHRDHLSHVCVTRTDFIATASIDGFVKLWKKVPEGIEFVKTFKAHLGSCCTSNLYVCLWFCVLCSLLISLNVDMLVD
jgi:hypothetical protein